MEKKRMIDSALTERMVHAQKLEKGGDYMTAVSEYKSIIAENTHHREAHLSLGYVYSLLGKYPEALKCYESALKLGSDYLIFFNIGSIYYKTGDYKKSVINLERSRKINGRFSLSTLVIGLCYSRMNNIRAAEENFQKVLSMWPGNRVALTALSIIYFNQSNFDKSLELVDRLIELNQNNFKIREFKSTILFRAGRMVESAAEIKNISRVTDGCRLYNDFIKSVPVEVLTDRFGTIEEKIDILHEKAEHDSSSLISLSLCHLFKGETDAALDYLFEARKRLLN
ncbi:MAG: hypothetical protein CVV44_09520 [Spirochaetae bacterium HGW-Spirochaetae-1]|jgi:tetratricopeptide (TPR) repeat protein|nr:MAG: hypothetical protein CVV44_09520 [Spirochaetae bacterium HGW-Spirochaetae-1]